MWWPSDAKFVTGDMVKDGAAVIDVGMDRDENGNLCGDVDFASVEPKASVITLSRAVSAR